MMTPEVVLDIYGGALWLIVKFVVIIVTPSLAVGLIVSTFQAATQINEQTLSFLPRLIITLLVIIYAGPFLLGQLIDYSENLITSLPTLIG